ncbi:MAG: CDP-alcohol phosphatidyltransferase family protein [Spirochaetaceae bacterium]|nr:CDP-alcohol phosphatidyltransferase family protein [Spirochaetaceae bacterium]
MRTADKFTLARMIFAPIFFVLYSLSRFFAGKNDIVSLCILIFLIVALIFAELTDFWDGYYARKLGEVSDTGKLFDPFADALLHITTFFCFTRTGLMPPVTFILIFWREFSQMFLRMMSIKGGFAVAARGGGKLKTVIYITAGFYALAIELAWKIGLFAETLAWPRISAAVLFYICVVLSYVSFVDYLILFKSKLLNKG